MDSKLTGHGLVPLSRDHLPRSLPTSPDPRCAPRAGSHFRDDCRHQDGERWVISRAKDWDLQATADSPAAATVWASQGPKVPTC